MNALRREVIAYVDAFIGSLPGRTGNRLRMWWIAQRAGHWGGGGGIEERVRFQAPERMSFGKAVTIGSNCFFDAGGEGRLVIGDGVRFNRNVHVNASIAGTIVIGNHCLIGPNVVLRTADHRFERTDIPIQAQGHRSGDIVLEENVWVGANATIVGGVRVATGAIIGAGAVVTSDVPAMSIAVGVPARVIRSRVQAATVP